MEDRFFSFNQYLCKKFGQRVQRLSIDANFLCPNLDGTLSSQGCIYCNNKAFAPFARSDKSIKEQISQSIEFYKKRLGVNKFIAYFQAFSNTYGDIGELKEKYDIIRQFPEIVGLFISTRPDCINEEKIKLISSYKDDYLVWIEYGLQTTHNRLLKMINRNHSYEDFLKALQLTRSYGINVGVHIILGLPTQEYAEIIEDAKRLAKLDIQGIKFHILHVLKDTALEKMYYNKEVKLLSEDEYVHAVCDFLEQISSSVVILRLISDAPDKYLIAPKWINNKQRVIGKIKEELISRNTRQGGKYESVSGANQ